MPTEITACTLRLLASSGNGDEDPRTPTSRRLAASEPPPQPEPCRLCCAPPKMQTWAKYHQTELGLGLSVPGPHPELPLRSALQAAARWSQWTDAARRRAGGDAGHVSSSALPTPPSSEVPQAAGGPLVRSCFQITSAQWG